MADLYDIARQVTDEVLGEGIYDEINSGNPDPGVQRAIRRGGLAEALDGFQIGDKQLRVEDDGVYADEKEDDDDDRSSD